MSETLPDAPPVDLIASRIRDRDFDGEAPRQKRIACVVCRKRKLKCDGARPSCGTCSRLGHDCSYDEVRRKSGPKRGYVKALEARLAQVETLLKTQDSPVEVSNIGDLRSIGSTNIAIGTAVDSLLPLPKKKKPAEQHPPSQKDKSFEVDSLSKFTHCTADYLLPKPLDDGVNAFDPAPSFSWEMIQLGIDEALPDEHVIDALHTAYFDKVAPYGPIIHKARYLASLDLAPNLRPPIALRYAIWTLAASVTDNYSSMQTVFYRRARKYAEEAEMKGHGEAVVSVAFAQMWCLLATYEYKLMYFPRAWMSSGRAARLCSMLGLNRLDGVGLDVKQCIPPPKDWTELEERRRTFWHAFCTDRYASIGTGWPMMIDEKDIMTHLPASDEAFAACRPSKSYTLKEALTPNGTPNLSSYSGVIIMAALVGRNLLHLHQPSEDGNDQDYEKGEFWKRHRHMDNILLNTVMALPPQFKLPNGIMDPNIVFTNMNIHTCTICLHQAAIFKADKFKLPASVSKESKYRCVSAAAQITSIMKMIGSQDLTSMNPFVSFCLYVAARVFVQYMKSNPNDDNIRSSLEFLISAMGHLKKLNPLTESFLVQLDVDMMGSMDNPVDQSRFPYGLKKGVAEVFVSDGPRAPESLLTPASSSAGKTPSDTGEPIPFLQCSSTIMNISIEKIARETQSKAAAAAAAAATSSSSNHTSPSMDTATPNEHSSQTSPSNHTPSSFSPIEEMVGIPSVDFMSQPQPQPPPLQHQQPQMQNTTGLGDFDFSYGSTTITGLTPKDLSEDMFGLNSLTVEQQNAMFSDIFAVTTPSPMQWQNMFPQ
ncbi:hypothetical protein DRE_02162 [Drechslerella stenobrocha 248]|uniref:Zn(2)-C6 fungal-type domain-containing protein n=1 Tax=Drechslerella stenobrocha 248 TaxID=1043628 RepID=W7I7T0_9PEZI|nr:hypothetical protein DRE_02162 [Drechslerella stenobrocha 248]